MKLTNVQKMALSLFETDLKNGDPHERVRTPIASADETFLALTSGCPTASYDNW